VPTEPREERYRPWALIGITLIALAGFAVFFLSFLVAPLAILLIFYVGFAASDRSKRNAKQKNQPVEAAPETVVVTETTTTRVTPADAPTYRRSR
jgi:ABC-type bacteriocin/lantibiotic exporter with double-glycine peptidase domain